LEVHPTVYSPWQGGAYERMMGLVKNALRKSYGAFLLDYVDLLMALYSIADTVKSRPLSYVLSEEILTPLTPNHFIRLRINSANSGFAVRNTRTDYTGRRVRELWEHLNGVVENFWGVFHSSYLTSLRERHTMSHKAIRASLPSVPKVNDVVLVKELGVPRAQWHLGKILSLDHRQAVAKVLCNKKELTRSINFLYPLELTETS